MNKKKQLRDKSVQEALGKALGRISEYDPAWGLEGQVIKTLGLAPKAPGFWQRMGFLAVSPGFLSATAVAAMAFFFFLLSPRKEAPRVLPGRQVLVAGPRTVTTPQAQRLTPWPGKEPNPALAHHIPWPGKEPNPDLAKKIQHQPQEPAASPQNEMAGAVPYPAPPASTDPVVPVRSTSISSPAPQAKPARVNPESKTSPAWKYGVRLKNNVFKPGQGGRVVLDLTLEQPGDVTLKVLKASGAPVRTLYQGSRPAGFSSFSWDGLDESGVSARAGMYWLVLNAGGRKEKFKVVLIR
jgi:hypothetical protein